MQSQLKNYHRNLQLALEVSTFHQQADNALEAMNKMVNGWKFTFYFYYLTRFTHFTTALILRQRRSIASSGELDSFGDGVVRDVAGQIMVRLMFSVKKVKQRRFAEAVST